MRTSIILMILFFSISSSAQNTFYLDLCENLVDEDNYIIKRTVENHPEKRFTYIIKDYYQSGELFTTGLAKSRNGKTKSGLFTFYYETGKKMAEGTYDGGLKRDGWKYWDKEGNEVELERVLGEIPLIVLETESTMLSGKCICYKKEGYWQEILKERKTENRVFFGEDQRITVNGIYLLVDKKPVHKLGSVGLANYFSEKIKLPPKSLMSDKTQFQIEIIIDEEGNVSRINFPEILNVVARKKISKVVMKTSGDWQPGEVNGKKVPSMVIVPIIFRL